MRIALALLLPLLLALPPGRALAADAASAAISTVAASPADAEVLEQLAGLIDRPLVPRDGVDASDLPALMQRAAQWPETRVLVVDRAAGVLHVLDARRAAVVTRLLTDESVRSSSYAIAFIAAELLGLSDQLAHAQDAQGAQDSRDTARASEPDQEHDDQPATDATAAGRFTLGASAHFTHYPAPGISLWRPSVEGWLALGELGAPGGGLHPRLGLRATVFGDWSAPAAGQRFELSQHDVDLRAALAQRLGRSTLLLALGVGAQAVHAQLAGAATTDRSLVARLSLGLQAQHRVAESLAIFAAVEGLLTPVATRYRADGASIVEPTRLGIAAALGLAWEGGSGARPR